MRVAHLAVVAASQVAAVLLLLRTLLVVPPAALPTAIVTATHTAHSRLDRLVLFVVDALRADMVAERLEMRFLRCVRTWQRRGCPTHEPETTSSRIASGDMMAFDTQAHEPTVTLPRLKAMMTGGVPQFLDLITNLVATGNDDDELSDSLISRFARGGNKRTMVLYGDDTWMKMFPRAFSNRSDPTTSSFFTADFVEVDYNVTRHLDAEFDPTSSHPHSRDWNVVVLHYLGVDHVGHQLGPDVPRMSSKLVEMDAAFQRVYEGVRAQDQSQPGGGARTLLAVLSDHGMNSAGNHGGSSRQETSTISAWGVPGNARNNSAHVGDPVPGVLPLGWASQVDIAPTIALLFGLGIPRASIGCVLPVAFPTPEDFQRAEQENEAHLRQRLRHVMGEDRHHQPPSSSCGAMRAALLKHATKSPPTPRTLLLQTLALVGLVAVTLALFALNPDLRQASFSFPGTFACMLLYGVSMNGSSAVEYEHAIVYHLTTTALLGLLLCRSRSTTSAAVTCALLVGLRVMRCRLEAFEFSRQAGISNESPLRIVQFTSLLPIPAILNGDLTPASKYLALAWCTALSASLATGWMGARLRVEHALLGAGFVAVWWYRLCEGGQETGEGIRDVAYICVRVVFASFGLAGLAHSARREAAHGHQNVVLACFIGVLLFVHRSSVLPLLACCVTVMWGARHLVLGPGALVPMKQGDAVVLLMGLGFCSFFTLGNSHSVGTIDISAGNVGFDAFNRERVAALSTCVIYTGPLVSAVLLLTSAQATFAPELLLLLQNVRLAVVSLVVLSKQDHLFIWSVFFPRWGYEIVWTVTLLCLVGVKTILGGRIRTQSQM